MNQNTSQTLDEAKLNTPNLSVTGDSNTLELLAEQPKIDIQRLEVGKVQIRKEIRTKQIQLPITLKQEVLIIDHAPSQQLAAALPDTKLYPQDPHNSSDWDTWVKINNDTATTPKIMINGQLQELHDPVEIVISQEFAHVQIQTLLAETVQLHTTTEEHFETIPVELRHEELVTNQVNYETPKVLHQEAILATKDNNEVIKTTGR